MRKATILFGLLAWGCASSNAGGEDVGQQTETSVSMTSAASSSGSGSESECEAGTEDCDCRPGGVCDGDLICTPPQGCVDFGGDDDESSTGDKPPTSESSSGADSTDDGGEPGSCAGSCGEAVPHFGGLCLCDPSCMLNDACCDDYEESCPGDCLFNEDCPPNEVCNSGQECVFAWGQTYQVCVDYWADVSPMCWDGPGDCYADVYFEMYYGGALIGVSPTHDDVLSTSWDECATFEINSDIDDGAQSSGVWSVVFLDDDGAINPADHIDVICEPGGAGGCTFIPLDYLKWGQVFWENMPERPAEVHVRFLALAE